MTPDAESEMDSLYAGDSQREENRETVDDESAEESAGKAVVPLKVLQGKHPEAPKEGDEIVVKVVRVFGDEAEIAYSETPPEEIGGEGEEQTPEQEIDGMDMPGPKTGGMSNPGNY